MSEPVKRYDLVDEGLCPTPHGHLVEHSDYARLAAERATDCERLNDMLRRTGYGQGQIDDYVYQCEEVDRLTAKNAQLREANSQLRAKLQGPVEIKLEHRGD